MVRSLNVKYSEKYVNVLNRIMNAISDIVEN